MNKLRFLRSLFWPPTDENWVKARASQGADVTYQPFLYCAAFYGALVTLLWWDGTDLPPGTDFGFFDVLWLSGSLISPLAGFAAVWLLRHERGKVRYFAFWMRMASGVGMITSLSAFESQRILFSQEAHPFEVAGVVGTITFLAVLVVRDIKILLITEHMADHIREARCAVK